MRETRFTKSNSSFLRNILLKLEENHIHLIKLAVCKESSCVLSHSKLASDTLIPLDRLGNPGPEGPTQGSRDKTREAMTRSQVASVPGLRAKENNASSLLPPPPTLLRQ